MSILPAQTIRSMGLISPCENRTTHAGMTYGLGPSGYDIRIAQTIWLWPFWGRLASAQEYFNLPNDVAARVCDKSSWARRFVQVQNTFVESGWRGYLTLELTRFLPWPIRIKAGTPIAQVIFERLESPTDQPYEGRYQDQRSGPQKARRAEG